MKLRCPVCHTTNSLEAYAADDAGRELLGLLASSGPLFRPLVHYLGLFRPAERDLSHTRALKLAQETLALTADQQQLATAMQETVESMRAKQQAGDHRPLKNHNYLKRVLESVILSPAIATLEPVISRQPRGKRAQAMEALAQWAGSDWLRKEISHGLIALLGVGREGSPAAETIAVTASLWETLLVGQGITIEQIDPPRIRSGFKDLLNNFEKWPEPKDLLARMPRRPERHQLDVPPQPDDLKKGKEFFKKMAEGIDE